MAKENNTTTTTKKNPGGHKATYAKDKHRGGYIIRVQGPNANRFAGRVVPVEQKNGDVNNEKLVDLIWTGKDDDSGQPVSLYNFEAKPKNENLEELPF